MASFAALVSLKNIIDTIQNHPNPPISLNNHQVEALLEKIIFLQEFLQHYSHRELYPADLESPIRDAAYVAEDVIESYIVDQIERSTSQVESSSHGDCFYQDMQKVVEQMDHLKRKAMEIKEEMGDEDHESASWTSDATQPSLVAAPSLRQLSAVVGFDDVLENIVGKLTQHQQSSRQIISIVGMGGLGKTTLALKVFESPHIKHYFDIQVWITISQKFKTRNILIEILSRGSRDIMESLSELSDYQLGERIHKKFSGERYLVVMDDMWSKDVWDEIIRFFPDNMNGSRIVITTRMSNLARELTNSSEIQVQLNFLDEDKSWKLFSKTVFGEAACPSELEEIGKKIVENCRGLPLSIVVIGGLLAKSIKTKQYWEYVARNLSSIVNSDNDERCLKILHLSYRHLPIHLKSCFLYMGIFREDERIDISWLAKLLVAEGFLKPIDDMMMEDVMEKYIKDLVERNLLLVDGLGYTGELMPCKIHDLLRDLCIKKAEEENFFCNVTVEKKQRSMSKKILGVEKKFLRPVEDHNIKEAQWLVGKLHTQHDIDAQRRIVFKRGILQDKDAHQDCDNLESTSLARTIVWNSEEGIPNLKFRLLRVLVGDSSGKYACASYMKHCFQLYNSRYLSLVISKNARPILTSSIALLWNLQTLIVKRQMSKMLTVPVEIWKLPQLRHVDAIPYLRLPNPPDNDDFVMWNLQSLSRVYNFYSSGVAKRIPNIKELSLQYRFDGEVYPNYECFNFEQLQKLEDLELHLSYYNEKEATNRDLLVVNLAFPHSLKKLDMICRNLLNWNDVTTIIGDLPNLEKLVLNDIVGTVWRPIEGQFFSSLKFLKLLFCNDLKSWKIESIHFPLLENLHLMGLDNLAEIPSEIGEIPNIRSIEIWHCSDSCILSAKRIAEEQEELGNSDLQVVVNVKSSRRHLESLASANFKIIFQE